MPLLATGITHREQLTCAGNRTQLTGGNLLLNFDQPLLHLCI